MNRPLPPCDIHEPGDPLCHYPNPKMLVVQQAHPADDGMLWQAIAEVFFTAVIVGLVLWIVMMWWLSLASVPR